MEKQDNKVLGSQHMSKVFVDSKIILLTYFNAKGVNTLELYDCKANDVEVPDGTKIHHLYIDITSTTILTQEVVKLMHEAFSIHAFVNVYHFVDWTTYKELKMYKVKYLEPQEPSYISIVDVEDSLKVEING